MIEDGYNKYCLRDGIGLSQDTPIYKYMPLEYFWDLLKNKRLYISKKHKFADIKESKLNIKDQLRFTRAIPNPEIPEEINNSQDISFKLNNYANLRHLYTSCWTLQDTENALMWQSYASKYGVRIQSTIGNFVASAIDFKYECICGHIDYCNDSPDKSHIDNLFMKNKEFADERELRIYIATFVKESEDTFYINSIDTDDNKEFIFLKIDPNVLINSIVISPSISPSCRESLTDIFNNRYKLKTRLSSIKYQH